MKKRFYTNLYGITKKDHLGSSIKHSLKFALFPKDNAVTQSIIEGWQYEEYIFDFIRTNNLQVEGTDIIDIGANNGNFTVDFGILAGNSGRVHAFEPQRILYYQLCGNVFLNGLDNVYCHNVALGAENGVTEIELPNYHSTGYVNFGDIGIKNESTKLPTELVRLRTLDSYEFENISFIKMDTQGYEPMIIDGALKTIEKHRPCMIIEFEEPNLMKFGYTDQTLKEKIEALGYKVELVHKDKVYNSYSGKSLDHICIPNEKVDVINYIPQ